MSAESNVGWIGAIACYPTTTYCAVTRIERREFCGPVIRPRFEFFSTERYDDAFLAASEFFKSELKKNNASGLAGLGVCLYGVVDSQTGSFLGSTQEGWLDEFQVADELRKQGFGSIVSEDLVVAQTDASCAAIAEYIWGGGFHSRNQRDSEKQNLAYFKIHSGIGSGVILAGRPWLGSLQPEMGHIPTRRAQSDLISGICPRHGDCMEGLASYEAMVERLRAYGLSKDEINSLSPSHKVWDIEAYYLAELATIATMVVAPHQIIFEGDIVKRHLFPKIKKWFESHVNKYPKHPNGYPIISPARFHGTDASVIGALELGRRKAVEALDKAARLQKKERLVELLPTARSRLVRPERISEQRKDGVHEFRHSVSLMIYKKRNDREQPSFPPCTVSRYSNKKRVLGLSITEEIEWVSAEAVDGKVVEGSKESGVLCDIGNGNIGDLSSNGKYVLADELRAGLIEFCQLHRRLIKEVAGIGVSTIGVVDVEKCHLVNVTRKPWIAATKGRPIVDFRHLFLTLGERGVSFPAITEKEIVVQNDATARCLLEYIYGNGTDPINVVEGGVSVSRKPRSILHIIAGEGINGAVILEGDLPYTLGHTELGHTTPQLHQFDCERDGSGRLRVERFYGCPNHCKLSQDMGPGEPAPGLCFEAVASAARFRREFGRDIWHLPVNHGAWDIAAHYLSQLAINGVLAFAPDRIFFGGQIFYEDSAKGNILRERICQKFLTMNNGYLPRYRDRDAVNHLIGLSKFRSDAKTDSALTMGCLAAFRSDQFGRALTVGELIARIDRSSEGRRT